MRLIDADALEESLENSCKDTYETKMFVDFMSYVDEAPTIKQSENCISRETATAKLFQSMMIKSSEFGNELSPEEKKFNDGLRKAVEMIRSLPSVTPSYNSIKTELKPCEDCVSREEAKKLIQGKIDDIPKNKDGTYGSMFGQYVNGLYCAKTAISYMQSVLPQHKKGKWIRYDVDIAFHPLHCSICGWSNHHIINKCIEEFQFCPNCGADMRESEE